MITRPMLAASVEDVSALRFPLLASRKLDGIRCIIVGGRALSRSLKPIANDHVRGMLESIARRVPGLSGLDGELMLKARGATFQDVSSAFMSRDGCPDFVYHVFDHENGSEAPFYKRLARAQDFCREVGSPLKLVPHINVRDAAHLAELEERWLEQGYEGVMLRDIEGPYKCGRSTSNEGYLMKLKRFVDAEAVIVGFEEQCANTNAARVSELGLTKRSAHKAGKVGKGTLGAFVVVPLEAYEKIKRYVESRLLSWGMVAEGRDVFRIGTGQGLTASLRQEIWRAREQYLGKAVKFRYQQQGSKDAPRIPVFLGFRSEDDL